MFTSDKGVAEFLDMGLIDITDVVISFYIQLINAQQVGFTGSDVGIAIFLVVVNARLCAHAVVSSHVRTIIRAAIITAAVRMAW